MKKRVLVVEDDPVLTRVLNDNLTFEGFEVRCVADGSLATGAARDFAPDLVLLDVNLPGKSGFELVEGWREGPRTPIIFLTAKGQKSDKLRGLKLGADDYVTKPFDLEELLARVHAVLRRARPSVGLLNLGSVRIDFERLKAWSGAKEIDLTHRDFEILRYLAERPNSIVSRNELLRAIWGYPDAANTRAVDHAIARLRKKIEDVPHKPRFIHTVHGDGYCLAVDGESVPGGTA
jgi:two-component system, OmpR family, response regulator VicR